MIDRPAVIILTLAVLGLCAVLGWSIRNQQIVTQCERFGAFISDSEKTYECHSQEKR